jgi:S1-C subfamily serine protease
MPGRLRRRPAYMTASPSKLGNANTWVRWRGPGLPILVVAALLFLGIANIVTRANFQEAEDGVLWVQGPEGVVASEIAEGTPAAAVGLSRGDVLLAVDDRPIQEVADVVRALHASQAGSAARYTARVRSSS